MTDRKPPDISWPGFVEQQIQAAQSAGEFDHLPGDGSPIPGIDEPLDDNWWIRRKLREEQAAIVPPLVEARKQIDRTRQEILQLSDEQAVRARLETLARQVWEAIQSPVPSPPIAVLPIEIDAELARWRQGRAASKSDGAS